MQSSHDEKIIQQLVIMLEMQDAMNKKVHDNWCEQDFPWYRAIWIECAEMLDHYGWKWWKYQKADREQVKLELVDIFHFGLSCHINGVDHYQTIAEKLLTELNQVTIENDFPQTLEKMAAFSLTQHHFSASLFAGCLQKIEMSFDELFYWYVGKNTLNFFRQDKGYKQGDYIKVWDGKEDNEHLVEVLSRLPDCQVEEVREQVYAGLSARYPG